MLVDREEIRPCEDLEEMVHIAIKIERLLRRKFSRYTKSKLTFNVITSKEKCNNAVYSMHEHDVLPSKSLDCKDTHDFNLGIVVESFITR